MPYERRKKFCCPVVTVRRSKNIDDPPCWNLVHNSLQWVVAITSIGGDDNIATISQVFLI